jgi:hypothetical protein
VLGVRVGAAEEVVVDEAVGDFVRVPEVVVVLEIGGVADGFTLADPVFERVGVAEANDVIV